METLLECRNFSSFQMQESFQSWFISFRLNYQEPWPFLKDGYFNSKTADLFPLAFDTHNVSLQPLLTNDLSWGSVFFFFFHYGDVFVQCSSSHLTLPNLLNCWSLSFTGEVLLKNPQNGNRAPVAWFRRIHVTWEGTWDTVMLLIHISGQANCHPLIISFNSYYSSVSWNQMWE